MALRTALLGASLMAAMVLLPAAAAACGGCAYTVAVPIPLPALDAGPRLDTPFIVTDHRMVLALRRDATVLWDQVRYAGRPEDFAWILPVRGDVEVTPGSAAFLDEIDALTQPSVASPSVTCNPTTGTRAIAPAPATPMGGALSDELRSAGVDVLRQTVAGPYEVTTVRGDDPTAIHAWLTAHGYRIGDDLAPELAWYTDLRMDFVVARLRPGEGVQAIQPLRVRLPAGTASLPLRMIRAGAADRTDLALFVIGEGRQEVTNFSSATMASDDVTWDFATGRSDYAAAFGRVLRRAGLERHRGRPLARRTRDAVRGRPPRRRLHPPRRRGQPAAAAHVPERRERVRLPGGPDGPGDDLRGVAARPPRPLRAPPKTPSALTVDAPTALTPASRRASSTAARPSCAAPAPGPRRAPCACRAGR